MKIIQGILALLSTVIPTFFPTYVGNRFTKAAYVLLLVFISLAFVTFLVERENDNDNTQLHQSLNQTKQSLFDIKQALSKSDLNYDSTNKVIINNQNITNNYGAKGMEMTASNYGRIQDVTMSDNQVIIEKSVRFNYYEFEDKIKYFEKSNNILDKVAHLFTYHKANKQLVYPDIKAVLQRLNYKIIEEPVSLKPNVNEDTGTVKVYLSRTGGIDVIVGNYTILKPRK